MPWTLDKNNVIPNRPLTAAEQGNLNTFMNSVRQGNHPKVAAGSFDGKYTKLAGTTNQYEIRLSQKNRAIFIVDDANQTVKILQVGGHT